MRINTRAFAVLAVAGFALPNHRLPLQPESRIWVTGTSTVKDYKCVAKVIDAMVFAPSAELEKLDIGELVATAEITVPVAKLDCGNGTMDEHMRKALKDKQFPAVQFTLSSYKVTGEDAALNGTMTIAGKALPVVFTGKVTDVGGTVRAVGSKQIKMTEWGVKPPSLMMGAMKVKNEVTIGFDVTLKR